MKQLLPPIDFHSMGGGYGSRDSSTVWILIFFKISYFVLNRSKKFIQIWNNLRVRKWWQIFHFCVNCPFKFSILKSNMCEAIGQKSSISKKKKPQRAKPLC